MNNEKLNNLRFMNRLWLALHNRVAGIQRERDALEHPAWIAAMHGNGDLSRFIRKGIKPQMDELLRREKLIHDAAIKVMKIRHTL